MRDATGNPIAIYRRHRVNNEYAFQLNEFALYGSDRLGLLRCDLTLHSQPQASGTNLPPTSGNRFAAESDGSGNLAISQLVYDSPYAKAHPGAPHKGEALLLQNLIAAPVNLNGLEIQAPLSSQTYTPASTLTVPANGRFALIHGDETNSTEKTAILAALGFSAADLVVVNRRSRPGALAMQRSPLFLTGWTG